MLQLKMDAEYNIYEVQADLNESDINVLGQFLGQALVGLLAGYDVKGDDLVNTFDGLIKQIKQQAVKEFQEKGIFKEGEQRLTDLI